MRVGFEVIPASMNKIASKLQSAKAAAELRQAKGGAPS
jgi:hypothetical protein